MRIGIDGRFIQDHYPGVGRYAYQLSLAMAQRFPEDTFYVLVSATAANTRYPLDALSSLSNVELVASTSQPASLANLFSPGSRIAGQRPDVVHFPHFQRPLALPCPTVTTLHDLIPWLVPQAMPSVLARGAFIIWIKAAARHSAQIITGSLSAARDLCQHLHIAESKITVIPHGVDAGFRPLEREQVAEIITRLGLRHPYLLYCGSNKPHKNIGRLVEAWSLVPDELRASHDLVIAGAQDVRYPTSQGLAERLGVSSSVVTLGECRTDDLPAIYNGALGFVFPSLYEGFGLPVLEAMACGTPVACSDHPALQELVNGSALTFQPGRAEQIAKCIVRELTEPATRATLSEAGKARAREFSWEKAADRTMALYRRVVEQERRNR